MMQIFLLAVVTEISLAQLILDGFESRQPRFQVQSRRGKSLRTGRQQGDSIVPGGVDFTGCLTDQETGLCCVEKLCNGQGPEECRTVYESSCTTKYVEKQPGKFVGDTACEKLPVEICGAGCTYEEGEEEC